ncbi:hypothetical protein GQ600_11217 [Phytophthora cactorum]|nr:hypothetical protein GQ600_11217 [Phytophthora cactorum]
MALTSQTEKANVVVSRGRSWDFLQRQLMAMQYVGSMGIGEGFHLEWSHLYCARDKCWYNDNVISAFTKTLTDNIPTTLQSFCLLSRPLQLTKAVVSCL